MAKSSDLCDWEVLRDSDASDSAAEEMEQQLDSSDTIFQADYFSFDQKAPSSDDGSDNPSWIDPASDAPFPVPPRRNSAEFWSDSGSDKLEENKLGFESEEEVEAVGDSSGEVAAEEVKAVWWKLPLDLLKYCAFKVSPVWSLSIAAAAAFVGFVILRRRLYKMKRKTHVKVIIDDKRVSQFMTHAARLNEAFSLVRRVPIIRPSLPSLGAAPWPLITTIR